MIQAAAKVNEYKCVGRLAVENRVLFVQVHEDAELERLRQLALLQRDRAIIGCTVEIAVSIASEALYDVQRSPLIPVLSTVLILLSCIGLHGALAMKLRLIQAHGVVSTGLIIACVLNFLCEALLTESGLGSDTLPQWLVLAMLLIPYSLNLFCSALSLILSGTFIELLEREEQCCGLAASDILEQQAEALLGQDTCCVCMNARKDAVITPCGHKALCVSCGEQLHFRGRACPVCRGRIESVVRVFES